MTSRATGNGIISRDEKFSFLFVDKREAVDVEETGGGLPATRVCTRIFRDDGKVPTVEHRVITIEVSKISLY